MLKITVFPMWVFPMWEAVFALRQDAGVVLIQINIGSFAFRFRLTIPSLAGSLRSQIFYSSMNTLAQRMDVECVEYDVSVQQIPITIGITILEALEARGVT
jgi:hypothetical protein